MKKWLFNPFVYVAGSKALLAGMAAMLATTIIGYFSRVHFDGVIDMHALGHTAPFINHILEQVIDWGLLTIVLYICGLIFSGSSVRLIDVAGTVALSRWVMIFPAIIGFTVHVPDKQPQTMNEIMALITPWAIVSAVLILVFLIWMIALFYNAFRVSCNLKGGKATAIFIPALIIAEIAASLIIHRYLY